MKLNASSFTSGEYVEIPPWVLEQEHKVRIVPCKLFQSTNGAGVLIGGCLRSVRGTDYGVNEAMLRFMEMKTEEGRAKECLVMFASSNDGNRTIAHVHGQVTLQEQLAKVQGVSPIQGRMGPYWWVDEDGNPTGGYGPVPVIPGDVM
jgi:hypothetical protein